MTMHRLKHLMQDTCSYRDPLLEENLDKAKR
jgi:hypothetical protein